jgi:hypothetical protein
LPILFLFKKNVRANNQSMNDAPHTITVPPPDEIERRITACKAELKALARLKRMSRAAKSAADARESRPPFVKGATA